MLDLPPTGGLNLVLYPDAERELLDLIANANLRSGRIKDIIQIVKCYVRLDQLEIADAKRHWGDNVVVVR